MDTFIEEVCILRVRLFKEYDLSLTVLSRERGLCTLYAFGGAKSRRRFVGCLNPFSITSCTIHSSRQKEYLVLQEAVLLQSSAPLAQSPAHYAMVQNCSLFLQASCRIGGNNIPQIYDIVYDIVQAFMGNTTVPSYFPLFFRFKVASVMGYVPSLSFCVACSQHIDYINSPFFSIERGGVVCHSCTPFAAALRVHNKDALSVLQHIISFPPKFWIYMPYTKRSISEAIHILDEFVQYHLGIVWHNGRFIAA